MPIIEITAKMWAQRQQDGSRILRYTGDVLDASDADAKRLISVNAAKAVRKKINVADQKGNDAPPTDPPADPPVVITADDEDPVVTPPVVDKPRKTATEDQWRAYAVTRGMSEEEAQSKDRAELIAAFA